MLVRKIKGRGANGVVEVHGEVLFAPGADIPRWKNRFSNRVSAYAAQEAPSNKRPRWKHYGKPLKSTMTAATSTRITKGGGFVYSAVGSTAPYALYVDQGTGVYGGNGMYKAKILPPWTHGGGSLYEHTWRVGGPGIRNRAFKPVMIKGQKGQNFFDAGLRRGFRSMRMRSYQTPAEGVSGMAGALQSFPSGIFRPGNTPWSFAFDAQLREWRAWRDDAWSRGALGKGTAKEPKKPKVKKPSRPKTKKPTKPKAPEKPKRPKKTLLEQAIASAKREMAAYMMRNPQVRIAGYNSEGFLVIWGTGQQKRVYWSIRTADLFADAGAQHSTGD